MSRNKKLVSDQIRELIVGSGLSRYQIAKLSGIDQSTLARFMSGERGLSTTALDALGTVLELQVLSRRAKRK